MSSLAETRRLRSCTDEDAERLDDLDDADRGVDAASWLAASDVGHAKCCLAWLRVAGMFSRKLRMSGDTNRPFLASVVNLESGIVQTGKANVSLSA